MSSGKSSSSLPSLPRKGKSAGFFAYDAVALKMELDNAVVKAVRNRGQALDSRLSNLRLLLTALGTLLAVVAQFYPGKYPHNWPALIVCCPVFFVVNMLVTYWLPRVEEDIVCETQSGVQVRARLMPEEQLYGLSASLKGEAAPQLRTRKLSELLEPTERRGYARLRKDVIRSWVDAVYTSAGKLKQN